ncbi:MAG: hypothetical protein R3C19_16445 [Planctomycetaceae bacterium]
MINAGIVNNPPRRRYRMSVDDSRQALVNGLAVVAMNYNGMFRQVRDSGRPQIDLSRPPPRAWLSLAFTSVGKQAVPVLNR